MVDERDRRTRAAFEALREQLPAILEGSLQPVGETLPPLPEELKPESATQQS